MRQLRSAVLAAGMLGFCLQSHAVAPIAEASFNWSTFSYQLFDLDPLDGIEASLTWGFQGSLTDTSAGNYDSAYDWTSPVESANGISVASATESAVGVSYYGYETSNLLGGMAQRYGAFTLSAMTLVLFRVEGSVSVAGVSDAGAGADASLQLSVSDYNSDPSYFSYSNLFVSTVFGVPNKSGVLTTSFVNFTESDLSAQFGANAQAYVMAPVPEPHTYGMLLAGLAVVAQVARRRCMG